MVNPSPEESPFGGAAGQAAAPSAPLPFVTPESTDELVGTSRSPYFLTRA
jgi:hypothetical protein